MTSVGRRTIQVELLGHAPARPAAEHTEARGGPEPPVATPSADVLLTVACGNGVVDVPAKCYAIEPPLVYVHIADADLGHGLPSTSRVLLTTAPAQSAGWLFLAAGWGCLERVEDDDLAPHLRPAPEHRKPIWRVRLDGGGRAAVGWGPGKPGLPQ